MKAFGLQSMSRPGGPALALAACLAGLAATPAQALSVVGTGAGGNPGGSATVRFDFDFGSATSFSSLAFYLNWDAAKLLPTGGSATYQGAAVDAEAALAAAGWFSDALSPGQYSVTWYALDPATFAPLPPLVLSGKGSLDISFALAPTMQSGQTALVTLLLEGSDDDLRPSIDARALITAVPEPATWALWLAGLSGLVAASAAATRRRRSA
jgi:hypothetical protein